MSWQQMQVKVKTDNRELEAEHYEDRIEKPQ
jgi:hypothetical protein